MTYCFGPSGYFLQQRRRSHQQPSAAVFIGRLHVFKMCGAYGRAFSRRITSAYALVICALISLPSNAPFFLLWYAAKSFR